MDSNRRNKCRVSKCEPQEEVHSGHFMVSKIDDTDSESEETDNHCSYYSKETDQLCLTSGKNAVSEDLSALFQYLKIAYTAKITNPRWNTFRGLKIHRRSVIRLNNFIWRGYHMQYFNHRTPRIVKFATPSVDQSRSEAIVLEGEYYRCRMEVLRREYALWRMFAVRRYRGQKKKATNTSVDNLLGLTTFGIQKQKEELSKFTLPTDCGDYTFSPSTLDEIMMDFEENLDIFYQPSTDVRQPSFLPVQPSDPLHEDVSSWNSQFSNSFTLQTSNKRALSDQSMHALFKERAYEVAILDSTTAIGSRNLVGLQTNQSAKMHACTSFVQDSWLPTDCCALACAPPNKPHANIDEEGGQVLQQSTFNQPIPTYCILHYQNCTSIPTVTESQSQSTNHRLCTQFKDTGNTVRENDGVKHFTPFVQNHSKTINKVSGTQIETVTSSSHVKNPGQCTAPLLCSVLKTPMPLSSDTNRQTLRYPEKSGENIQPNNFFSFNPNTASNSLVTDLMPSITESNVPGSYGDDDQCLSFGCTIGNMVDRKREVKFPDVPVFVKSQRSKLTSSKHSTFSLIKATSPITDPQQLRGKSHHITSTSKAVLPMGDRLAVCSSLVHQHGLQNQRNLHPVPVNQATATCIDTCEANSVTLPMNQCGASGNWRTIAAVDSSAQPQPSKLFRIRGTSQLNPLTSQQSDNTIRHDLNFGTVPDQSGNRDRSQFTVSAKVYNSGMFGPSLESSGSQPFLRNVIFDRQHTNSEVDHPKLNMNRCRGTSRPVLPQNSESFPGWSGTTVDAVQHSSLSGSVLYNDQSQSNELTSMHAATGLPADVSVGPSPSFSLRGRCNSHDNLFPVQHLDPTGDTISPQCMVHPVGELGVHDNGNSSLKLSQLPQPAPSLLKVSPNLPSVDLTEFQYITPSLSNSAQHMSSDVLLGAGTDNAEQTIQNSSILYSDRRNLSNHACLQILKDLVRIHRTLDRPVSSNRDSHLKISRSFQRSADRDTARKASSELLPLLMKPKSSFSDTLPSDVRASTSGEVLTGTCIGRTSKAATLHNTADYIAQLQEECDTFETLCKNRKSQISNIMGLINTVFEKCSSTVNSLGTEQSTITPSTSSTVQPSSSPYSTPIYPFLAPPRTNSMVSSSSPVTGICSLPDTAREWFQEYVEQRTEARWKFYMFSLVLEKLFQSYWTSVNTTSKEHLVRSLFGWLYQHCSLAQLRPAVMQAMCKLCVDTSILSDPNRLPEEARRAACDLFKANQTSLDKSIIA